MGALTDEHYDDAKMKKIYPNAKGVKKGKTEEKDAGSKASRIIINRKRLH